MSNWKHRIDEPVPCRNPIKLRLLTIMIWPSSITKVAADRPASSSRKSRQQRHPSIPERSFSEPSRGIRMLDPERILHVGHTFHLMRQFLSSLPLFSGSHHASQMHDTTVAVDRHQGEIGGPVGRKFGLHGR